MSESAFLRVVLAAEVPTGSMREINVGSRCIVLCHTREGWFAVDNLCTHAHAKLSEGRLRRTTLICPLHGGKFDCRIGTAIGSPAVAPLRSYAVRISGEVVEIEVTERHAGS